MTVDARAPIVAPSRAEAARPGDRAATGRSSERPDAWLEALQAMVIDVRKKARRTAAPPRDDAFEVDWLRDVKQRAEEVKLRRGPAVRPGDSALIEAEWLAFVRARAEAMRSRRRTAAAARAAIEACDEALAVLYAGVAADGARGSSP